MPPRVFELIVVVLAISLWDSVAYSQDDGVPVPGAARTTRAPTWRPVARAFLDERPADPETAEAPPPAPGVEETDDSPIYTPIEPEEMMGEEPLQAPDSTSVWSKVPNARIFPRQGNFFIPPSGPGYYSLMDQLWGIRRDGPPKSGYPAFALMSPGFFDADFRYLDKVPMAERAPWERLKRIHIGDDFLFSTGGETWIRYHDFHNGFLTQTNDAYDLSRVRVYGDLWYQDKIRVYTEFIDANRGGGSLPPADVDIDRADLLDAFVDLKLADVADHPVYVRAGRQEILLGSQRLISPAPSENMRRNFDGVRLFRQGEKWDFDAFWLEPVIPNPSAFDQSDHKQQLAGAWLTYRPEKGTFLDLYYLYYNNANTVVQEGIVTDPTQISTLGTRYVGDKNNCLWDFEGALQLGTRGNEAVVAGMATTGVGYHWSEYRINPTAWLYFDYASGDSNPNSGNYTTFNQLFPFGHYYLGWTDSVGRQNIQDLNVHLGMYPVPWMTTWLQYHHFWLAESRDALYDIEGHAIRRDPTGRAGNNVGDEVDLVMNFHIDAHSDFIASYAQLFGGSFLQNTSSATQAPYTQALYLIYNFRW